jgi:hypothetical protein
LVPEIECVEEGDADKPGGTTDEDRPEDEQQ